LLLVIYISASPLLNSPFSSSGNLFCSQFILQINGLPVAGIHAQAACNAAFLYPALHIDNGQHADGTYVDAGAAADAFQQVNLYDHRKQLKSQISKLKTIAEN
jgi:hypothetical protein